MVDNEYNHAIGTYMEIVTTNNRMYMGGYRGRSNPESMIGECIHLHYNSDSYGKAGDIFIRISEITAINIPEPEVEK